MENQHVPPIFPEFMNSVDVDVLVNGKGYPKVFYARHMKSGLCGYNKETVMVDDDAIKAMLPTFRGKPVYMNHRADVPLENIKEEACGYVTRSFWNEMDGWGWSEILIIDDAAIEAIERRGISVSNAYNPTAYEGGGVNHNVPYDRKITNGEFHHLALVDNPRYENAKIFTPEAFKAYQDEKKRQNAALLNSKKEGSKMTLKLFKDKREEVSEIEAGTSVEFTNSKGQPVVATVEDMIKAVEAAQAKPQTVLVNGKEMTVEQLTKQYEATLTNGKDGEGEETPAETPAPAPVTTQPVPAETPAPVAPNAAPTAPAAGETLENGVNHFDQLSNAKGTTKTTQTIDTEASRLARGKARY